jgi:diphosphate-dependent phosphofructokinase
VSGSGSVICTGSYHPDWLYLLSRKGLAPCLSCSIAELMRSWMTALQEKKIAGLTFRMYLGGYKGLLTGDSFLLPESEWASCIDTLVSLGGSPIGNSRVKLTNIADCIKRGYVQEGGTPLEVASQQLLKDQIHVLHTIGGDDTNTQAATLSDYLLKEHNGKVIVIGMPKTIDNDVYPIVQTFGAQTAAVKGAEFFASVVNECTANPRMLILHECMGRDSGYLTAQTASEYRKLLAEQHLPATTSFPFVRTQARDVHAIWIPELTGFDLLKEGQRLKAVMDQVGCVNVFFGEGTGVEEIVKDMEAAGEVVPRDAFGHVALAKIKPGDYFSHRLAALIGAEKTIVQRSGYFARASPANAFDQQLIAACAHAGVAAALEGVSGCMGQDEDKEGTPIRAIEFERIKGHKPFNVNQEWFQSMLKEIGQA